MAVTNTPPDLLRGTVDLLILRTLAHASLHGCAIAQRLRAVRARYYTITAAGTRHLAVERMAFERLLGAMTRVMEQE